MAEQKRHMDVPQERFLDSLPQTNQPPQVRGQKNPITQAGGHTGQQSVTQGQTPEPEYTSVYSWRYTCVYRS